MPKNIKIQKESPVIVAQSGKDAFKYTQTELNDPAVWGGFRIPAVFRLPPTEDHPNTIAITFSIALDHYADHGTRKAPLFLSNDEGMSWEEYDINDVMPKGNSGIYKVFNGEFMIVPPAKGGLKVFKPNLPEPVGEWSDFSAPFKLYDISLLQPHEQEFFCNDYKAVRWDPKTGWSEGTVKRGFDLRNARRTG